MTPNNRHIARKSMRSPAKVTLKDASKLDAETTDLSLGGVALLVQSKVAPGQYCAVTFSAELNQVMRTVSAVGQIIYCMDTRSGGFHVGVQFLDLDAASIEALNELMT